ncbi:MAG TPA: XRE family transcriptional regulator [Candidatus Avalokitesvara rifleensis]|uniref:XRE family transcriptional regulator n=1 Tax=Candidatus Avalokitesvara rifleensis TaxID=3367620 RepID=UPI0027140CFE|nr:S24 family peptidase [Candidatus Brocadiales bacterium]
MKIGTKLRLLRAEKGWTKSSAARAAKIPISSYRNYEKESLNRKLPGKSALALANAFGISLEYLLDDARDYPPRPRDRRFQVAQETETSDDGEKTAVRRQISVSKSGAGGNGINIVGHVAAGETDIVFDDAGLPAGGSIDEPLERLPDVKDENAYGLVISGNSMLPGYPQGTRVIVCPSEKVRSGDLVICRLNSTGKVYIKEIAFSSDRVILKSHNMTAYEPVAVAKEDIVFCHKVVWTKRP